MLQLVRIRRLQYPHTPEYAFVAREGDPPILTCLFVQMADKDGFDFHKRVLSSLPSVDFSLDDSESNVSLGFA